MKNKNKTEPTDVLNNTQWFLKVMETLFCYYYCFRKASPNKDESQVDGAPSLIPTLPTESKVEQEEHSEERIPQPNRLVYVLYRTDRLDLDSDLN